LDMEPAQAVLAAFFCAGGGTLLGVDEPNQDSGAEKER